ncbi:MAG: acyl carrier protein [Nitrospiraceae bacterium]|nr:acyl carrier protein [Nitrospiraceae bacterium]
MQHDDDAEGIESVREQIREFVLDAFMYGAAPEELDDDASFLETGIMDSTGIMELVMFLEEEFDFKVQDTEMVPENLDSVDNLCQYLSKKGVPA